MKLYTHEQMVSFAIDFARMMDGRSEDANTPEPEVEIEFIGYTDEKFFKKHGTSIMSKTKGYDLGGAVSDLQDLYIAKFNNK